MNCKTCVYYKNENEFGVGMCCRYPPVPVPVITGTNMTIKTDIRTRYPEVQSNFWCGEHVHA